MNKSELIQSQIDDLHESLKSPLTTFFQGFEKKLGDESASIFSIDKVSQTLIKVCACSQFIREKILLKPELLQDLVNTDDLFSNQRRQQYLSSLQNIEIKNDAHLMQQLRLFRYREMIRIAWRDLAGWADLDETLRDLTTLAEACIEVALEYYYEQGCNRRGVPVDNEGRAINLVVIGMGKLGAWELNYSSDIDLIFAYEVDGVLNDRKETSYGEFFTRICRQVVKALDEMTVDGFVFRTDTRLRPFGDSGPLVMSFEGMENYYMTQAREWERYAMIKARQVAGDYKSGKLLMDMIRPFVYRRYLDYGAFEELRKLKIQITQELKRKDRLENVKLGPGGIREIEFIGQAFQLIRGGCEPKLQRREILVVLETLKNLKLLEEPDVEKLINGYIYLRKVENHIQQYKDQQVHDLPTEECAQASLTQSMGFAEWKDFKQQLGEIRAGVHEVFEKVFSLSEEEQVEAGAQQIWQNTVDEKSATEILTDYGYNNSSQVLLKVTEFRKCNAMKKLTPKGAGVLERLLPKVIEAVSKIEKKDTTLGELLVLFEKIAGRSVYLSLLEENPGALSQLITLTQASSWICKYLAQYPVLLDELLDAHSLYEPLHKQQLKKALAQEIVLIDELDDELLMNRLRQFAHQNILRVAAADIMDVIPVMVVSDYLTEIAEVILQQVVDSAWKMMIAKHGFPPGTGEQPTGFAILGLGKLGGQELGYGSDLDMVFVYDCENTHAMTNGSKSIGCTQFYVRLAQKIRHILETKLLSGMLYEVDLRLRPSGDSGLLVTHISTYLPYLQNEAWTWEHQALVRARYVAGDSTLKGQFDSIRKTILALPREKAELQREVREMREKMRDNLIPKNTDVFHLKQSHGGIADIEFIVQFLVLNHAVENTELTHYTDNVRIIKKLAANGLLREEQAERLINAFCHYRDYGHHRVLQDQPAVANQQEFMQEREQVKQIWRDIME